MHFQPISQGIRGSGTQSALAEASRWEVSLFKQDPVCGKWLASSRSHATIYYHSEGYHLYSPLCEAIFKRDPGRQLLDPPRRRNGRMTRRVLIRK